MTEKSQKKVNSLYLETILGTTGVADGLLKAFAIDHTIYSVIIMNRAVVFSYQTYQTLASEYRNIIKTYATKNQKRRLARR